MTGCAPCGPGIQTPRAIQPSGSFASCNSRLQIVAGESALVAGDGPGVAQGRFGWADLVTGKVTNAQTDAAQRLGLVLPQSGTWQKVYWDSATKAWWIRPGLPVTLAAQGDFFMRFEGGAIRGQPVYANPLDGTALSGATLGAVLTPWTVVTSADPGCNAIISTWSYITP
jgi:hypothetical protein